MVDRSNFTLRHEFKKAVGSPPHSDTTLRRPKVPDRTTQDYSGPLMARYINGLEKRLDAHIGKHAPRWHHQETQKILKRWSAQKLNHPAPRYAAPPDKFQEASRYAVMLVKLQIDLKLQKMQGIRARRSMDISSHPMSLKEQFHKVANAQRQKTKHTI